MRPVSRALLFCTAAAAMWMLAAGCSDDGGATPKDRGVERARDGAVDGPRGDTSRDGPKGDGSGDGPAGDTTRDGPAGDTTRDGPAGDTTRDGPAADTTRDQGGSTIDLNGPDGLLGQTVPSPTPAANPSDPWDASSNQQDGHNATLATAWPTGVVTPSTNNPYVQIVLDSRGVAFFVFQAGAGLTTFNVGLNHSLTAPPQWATLKWAHLHNVTNNQFGSPVAPTTYTVTSQLITAAWPVTPGNTYVLELATTGSGFV